MTYSLEDEKQRIVANMDNEQHSQEQDVPETTDQEQQPDETIHIHFFPDAIVILKEDVNTSQVVDSVPVIPQKISFIPAYAICVFYLFLILSCIAFQVYEILNPPTVTVTIIPKEQTVTTVANIQLDTGTPKAGQLQSRQLPAINLQLSGATQTTGIKHQDAIQARGFITFYNGQFSEQTIAAGTILTGADEIEIITDEPAIIPAANPPIFGQAKVSAHAITAGSRGNIPAYDINVACCATSVLAKNVTPFIAGQDERTFTIVTQEDIAKVENPLKQALTQSMQGALQAQMKQNETLVTLPCSPTLTPNHNIGDEANEVTVTVSETCSGIVYDTQSLEQIATTMLTAKARQQVGTFYQQIGNAETRVINTTLTNTTNTLTIQSQGVWAYMMRPKFEQSLKDKIAGKTKQEAIRTLLSLPGIETASMSGVDDNQHVPNNTSVIRIVVFERVGYTHSIFASVTYIFFTFRGSIFQFPHHTPTP